MSQRISATRKVFYYAGMGLMVLGALLFLSTFVTFVTYFSDFSNFERIAKTAMLRALSGVVLLIVGSAAMLIGVFGLAGSGVELNPEQARRDLDP